MSVMELPGMVATLCSYESQFGPYHPQTLSLLTQVGVAYGNDGDYERGCVLLERAVRDLTRHLGPDHELRLRALWALHDLQKAAACSAAGIWHKPH